MLKYKNFYKDTLNKTFLQIQHKKIKRCKCVFKNDKQKNEKIFKNVGA